MNWIVEPLKGFNSTGSRLLADTCSGGGELRHCDCTAGLVICGPSPNSFIIKPKSELR